MKKNIKLLNYLLEYDICAESLNEYLEATETERLVLLNKVFKTLNKMIYDLTFSVDIEDIELIDKAIQLIDLLCSTMEFKPEEIMNLKKRIKKSR